MLSRFIGVGVVLLLLVGSCGESEEAPETLPEGALPLSELARLLENGGYDPILEIEFEEGVWEVEAFKDGQFVEIEVDPISGAVEPDE
jgi:hypothetical protein